MSGRLLADRRIRIVSGVYVAGESELMVNRPCTGDPVGAPESIDARERYTHPNIVKPINPTRPLFDFDMPVRPRSFDAGELQTMEPGG